MEQGFELISCITATPEESPIDFIVSAKYEQKNGASGHLWVDEEQYVDVKVDLSKSERLRKHSTISLSHGKNFFIVSADIRRNSDNGLPEQHNCIATFVRLLIRAAEERLQMNNEKVRSHIERNEYGYVEIRWV